MVNKNSGKANVYFNGKFVFETTDPEHFVQNIRNKRRMGVLDSQLNVVYYKEFGDVRITTENGRVRRPLVIVDNGKPKLTQALLEKMESGKIDWMYLVNHGIIEYLDAEEEENSFIAIDADAVTKEHTHMELHPISILGLSASLIPYPEYNRGDRINYGAKMVGQSIGLLSTNYQFRTDTKFNTMMYPQAPGVTTDTSQPLIDFPEGQNVVVAVLTYDGYNMNDAIVLNKSSVERGLFRSFYFRTYETIKKRYWGGQEDEIRIPEPGIKGYRGEEAYAHLSEDGLAFPETQLPTDGVLLGKVSPLRFLSSEEFTSDLENKRETSLTVRHGEKGIVDKVIISETTDANQLFKIRIRDQRIPELGDKFASRHGQKGVVGLITPQENLPFAADGTIPDIIFNPHAIPSRMTIGHLLEILAGKAGALSGEILNSTAFHHQKEDEIRAIMRKVGFREDGKQTLYEGRTGRKFDVLIFTGITYYLKLDHMVADKIHARSQGPIALLTKQPTEGRAKQGGLRIGEMEQQCIIGHGAALVLKERFDSDKTRIPLCKACGVMAVFDYTKNRSHCPSCKSGSIIWVETSYAFKLALDEFKAVGIYPKIKTEEY